MHTAITPEPRRHFGPGTIVGYRDVTGSDAACAVSDTSVFGPHYRNSRILGAVSKEASKIFIPTKPPRVSCVMGQAPRSTRGGNVTLPVDVDFTIEGAEGFSFRKREKVQRELLAEVSKSLVTIYSAPDEFVDIAIRIREYIVNSLSPQLECLTAEDDYWDACFYTGANTLGGARFLMHPVWLWASLWASMSESRSASRQAVLL